STRASPARTDAVMTACRASEGVEYLLVSYMPVRAMLAILVDTWWLVSGMYGETSASTLSLTEGRGCAGVSAMSASRMVVGLRRVAAVIASLRSVMRRWWPPRFQTLPGGRMHPVSAA